MKVDLMKLKEMNWKKNRNRITVAVILLFLLNTVGELTGVRPHLNILSNILNPVFGDKCAPIELELQKLVVEADSVYTIPLNSLTDFEWTELYVISGPRMEGEIEEITGIEYEKIISDDRHQLIFIKYGKIVKGYSSACRNFSWGWLLSTDFDKFSNSSDIRVRKRLVADEWWVYEAVPN